MTWPPKMILTALAEAHQALPSELQGARAVEVGEVEGPAHRGEVEEGAAGVCQFEAQLPLARRRVVQLATFWEP